MTTPMRWADSDSDDSDDGYNMNEESSETSNAEEVPISTDDKQNRAIASHKAASFSSRGNQKNKFRNDNKSQRGHQQHAHHQKNHQKGGNSNYGGKNRSQHPQHSYNKNRGGPGPDNWKELAKASSQFSSDNSDSTANIDGSAWMAQRRAKIEQEAKEQKKKEAERLQQEHEEKQSRRKSQLNALKAAMCEIKQKQVEEGSQKVGSSPAGVIDTPSSNVQILKKNTPTEAAVGTSKFVSENGKSESQGLANSKPCKTQTDTKNRIEKDDLPINGSWRRAKASPVSSQTASKPPSHSTQPPPPPKYSYTIGQSPSIISNQKQNQKPLHKAELQPDRSSVKFTRNRGGITDDKKTTMSDLKRSDGYSVDTRGQETMGHVPISSIHKDQIVNDATNSTNGNSRNGDKGKKYQQVIVAFDDASGHPSSQKKKNKKNKQEVMNNKSGESDAASSVKSKSNDDNYDEEVASTKTSSSRGSSTLHSSSRSGRGGGGGKNGGRGVGQRRDSRSGKSGRGRGRGRGRGKGREGRGLQNSSISTPGRNANEGEGRGNLSESGKRGSAEASIQSNDNNSNSRSGGGRSAGREGQQRNDSKGTSNKSPNTGNDGNRNIEKRESSSGRGRAKTARGNDGRGGRGNKAGRGGRGGQRNSGKDSSNSSSAPAKKSHRPKYSYEIGKD